MTQYDDLIQPDNGQDAIAIEIIGKEDFDTWFGKQSAAVRAAATAQKFDGGVNDLAIFQDAKGDGWYAALIVEDGDNLGPWAIAKAAEALPAGTYRLKNAQAGDAMLGWMLGHYRFDDYQSNPKVKGDRILLTTEPGRVDSLVWQAQATALTRDLVNCPAGDLGPEQLEQIAARIAKAHKAELRVTRGSELEAGYPVIHAVGRAAARDYAPRLIEWEWGDPKHPRVAIIGKGVTFDSGGLNMKSASGMRIMKKDMGGAAHALALAELIMKAKLPVRLHCLVAAVENCVSGNALRPGDIVKSRKGIFIEIDNTDAEGRLILCDTLARAAEDKPDIMINFATLTGAARVALGPDLPALFANDDNLADGLMAAGKEVKDPVWHMPLWMPYNDMLDSDIADTMNSGGSFAGAITAALFMEKFVPDDIPWAHFDTYAWRPTAKAGRPKGGEALGLRAAFRYLTQSYLPR